MNTSDLYNELAGLAHAGSASNVDFHGSNVGVTENNLEQAYPGLNTSDDYLELDDLLAPGETFSYGLPNDQFLQYPLDQPAYNSHYDYGTISAFDASVSLPAFDASGSLQPLPSIFDDMPDAPNNLVNLNCLNPAMKDPFS